MSIANLDIKLIPESKWNSFALTAGIAITLIHIGLYVYFSFVPGDDLLRHVVSYAWDYSHRKMFLDANLPNYNLYPLFDWIASQITLITSPWISARFFAVFSMCFMAFTTWKVASYWGAKLKATSSEVLMICCLFLIAGGMDRASMGRPEVWCLMWGLWATTFGGMSKRWKFAFLGFGVAATLSYWLFALMIPMLMVSDNKVKEKVIATTSLTIFYFGFWWFWSGGDIVNWPTIMDSYNKNRIIHIIELSPMISVILNIFAQALIILLVIGLVNYFKSVINLNKLKNCTINPNTLLSSEIIAIVGLIAYLSTNIIRMFPISMAASFQFLIRGIKCLKVPHFVLIELSIICSLYYTYTTYDPKNHIQTYPFYEVEKGSRVIAPFNGGMFSTVNANPGTVQVFPAMEIGASDKIYQGIAMNLQGGGSKYIDCKMISEKKLTHAITYNADGMPECFDLIKSGPGKWDLWRVIKNEKYESSGK